jgi:hypothetical protein
MCLGNMDWYSLENWVVTVLEYLAQFQHRECVGYRRVLFPDIIGQEAQYWMVEVTDAR